MTLAGACAITPEVGCVSVPQAGQQPLLATHVQDWRDEVIYQVIVDRFANGDVNNDFSIQPGFLARYQGGDWKGIQDHLDYFEALGVTTLWISPVVKNIDTDAGVDAYHGYWSQDLTQPNPHFGDMASLRSFVAAAHDHGLKVVLDIVCNHMGQVFFYDMNRNGQPDVYVQGNGTSSPITVTSEYDPDWNPMGIQSFSAEGPGGRAPLVFIVDPAINRVPPQPGILGTAAAYHGKGRILDYSDFDQLLHGDFTGGLKDVATENDTVRATLVDAYAQWVEKLDLDGYRIDTVKHVEHEFWQVFAQNTRTRLAKQGKNNFIMFGEVFDGDDKLAGSYTAPGELDSIFYFPQHFTVYELFANAHRVAGGAPPTKQIYDLWNARSTDYGTTPQANGINIPPSKALINFLDNHDGARFLFDAEGDVAALRNALTLLFTEDGIPDIYYGTEQDFSGGNDPANREVLWTTNFNTTGDTFRHIAKMARIRKAYAALRRGDLKVVWATNHTGTEDDAGVFAFERSGGDAGDQYALMVFNIDSFKASTTSFQGMGAISSRPNTTLVDILNPMGQTITVDATGAVNVTVPAQSAMILVPSDQVVKGI